VSGPMGTLKKGSKRLNVVKENWSRSSQARWNERCYSDSVCSTTRHSKCW